MSPHDGSADVLARSRAIASSSYRALEENQKVECGISQGLKGPQAENLRPVSPLLPMTALKRGIFLHEPIVPGA